MIIIIILIILLILFYNKNNEHFTSASNSNKQCDKYIIVKDSLYEYIQQINNSKPNTNLLHPSHVLPYNLNSTDQYNILNNFGIKNLKKRKKYMKNINNNQTISFNTTPLLKNYDNILNDTFYKNSTTKLEYPELFIINNKSKIQWSYEIKYLNDSYFYLYFNNAYEQHNFNSLKLSNDFKHDSFNLNINHYKNRYIYKLEYKGNKPLKMYVVLKKNNKIILKSNETVIKLN
jgi:hypothetical protein